MIGFFGDLSLPFALALFAVAAAAVWQAGGKLAVLISALADRLGLSQGFAGMLLLGGITSLPEIATAGSAGLTGSATLAVSNLIGSASINVLLLCVADFALRNASLTSTLASPGVMLQGVIGMLLMVAVAGIALVGDAEIAGLGIGFGATGLFVACGVALWIAAGYERNPGWTVADGGPRTDEGEGDDAQADARSTRSLIVAAAIASAIILGAGFVLSQTGDRIAERTGLGSGLVGLVLVGFATSLPELSSILAALRIRRYDLAVGDAFGTNLFNVAVLFVVDVAYRDGPALAEAGRFAALAALLAVGVIGVYLVGVIERRDATLLRAGLASWATMLIYALGLAGLYFVST